MTPDILTTTSAVDPVFYFIFGICAVMLVGITVAMVWFVIRYNRKRCPEPLSQKDHNLWLEITWTVIPTILVLLMFWYGWAGYLSLRQIPDDAIPVTGKARMWSWQFVYENGKTSGKLYVPVGKPVKVKLIAEDVLHAFFVPAFRVKRDCVPGMETYVWFTADKPGSYNIFCAEYCGVGHADMTTSVEALPAEEFDAWLAGEQDEKTSPAVKLLEDNGCTGCHSFDGSDGAGPTFAGLKAGVERVVTVDDATRTVTVDADYLRRAIVEPGAEVVKEYAPLMPAFADLTAEELQTIVDYLAQGSPQDAAGPDGAALFENNGCGGCHSTDGSDSIGPTLQGIAGTKRVVERDGEKVQMPANRDYLRRAVVEPGTEIVEGYAPMMPAFGDLSDEELDALLDYLERL